MKKWILPAVALIIFGIILFSLPKATSNNPRVNLTPEPSAQVEAVSTEMVITKNKTYSALLRTTQGDITMQFSADKTPITVNNFVYLARKRFYDNTVFHRIIKGFMIQGGDPEGTGMGGPGYEFEDEVFEGKYTRGTVAMANSGPDTNGSQFFVTLAPTEHLNGKHTIFGKVVAGMENVKKIGLTKVDEQMNKPFTPITINSIKIVRVGKDAKAFNAAESFAKNQEIILKQEEEKKIKMKEFLKQLEVDESKIITIKENGLQYFVRKEGKGKTPVAGDTIVAHYAGYLVDGTKFDSSFDRKQPFETQIGVGKVIPGWDEAFLQMKEGEKRVLILPYYLAYGERGYPPVIPAKATLIFDVELISVNKKK